MPNDDDDWARLCRSVGDGALAADARFDSAAKRCQHAPELIALLDERLQQRTADDWLQRWRDHDVVASAIGNLADLANDPQAWENRYLLETYCDEVQRDVTVRGLPVGLSKTPGEVRSLGPELGQHTEEVLVDTLGYSWEDVGELKAAGAIL
jgi:crotonobetainyl-CoA:carnitine CoA-transferase CaiB-like acyl-CoA transferase